MTAEEVKPFVRHWVEVYMTDGSEPMFRGLFLCGDGQRFAVNGHREAADALPTPPRAGLRIESIRRIGALEDPVWLVESNRAAAVVSARALFEREKNPDK